MRKANSYEIYENEGKFEAIKFGNGSMSEHKDDIHSLLEKFGANEKLESTKAPDEVNFFKTDKGETVLVVGERASRGKIPRELEDDDMIDKGEHTKLAWSGSSFGVITKDEENAKRLEALYEAIQNKDVSLYYEGGLYRDVNTGKKTYISPALYVGIASRTQDFEIGSRLHIAETRDLVDKKTYKISEEKREMQKNFEQRIDKELQKAINESKNKMEKNQKKMQDNIDKPKVKDMYETMYNNEKSNYEFRTENLKDDLTMERKKNQYHQFLITQDDETIDGLKETYADLLINSVIDKNAEKQTHFGYVGDRLKKELINDNARER